MKSWALLFLAKRKSLRAGCDGERMRISGPRIMSWIFLGAVLEGLLLASAWADPVNPRTYYSGSNARALALDTHRNRLYVGVDSATNNLLVFTLDSNGDTTNAVTAHTYDAGRTVAMSLDARRNRLYLANNVLLTDNEINIVTLMSNGDPSGVSGHNLSSGIAQALVLDAQRNRLYVGLGDALVGLAMIRLTPQGNFDSSVTYGTNNRVNALALDAARDKLYLGYNNGAVGTCDLDANGEVVGINNTRTAGSGHVTSLALNSFDNCLYVAANNTILYTFPLMPDGSADPGELAASPNSFTIAWTPNGLLADATRRRLYFGTAVTGTDDLRWIDLDSGGIPNGTVFFATANDVRALAMDAERRKFYTTAATNNVYFDLTEPGMPYLLINHGAATTAQEEVELHWSVPNAHFVLVEGTSDLVNYYFPVTFAANTVFDQWHSTDDSRWSNVAGTRANTLTVRARLTSGAGLKTVRVWFREDAGIVNGGAVSHYRETFITLNGDTPTFTPTFTRSPTVTPTPTHTISPSPTCTPSVTGTATGTGTVTATATLSPTGSPSGSPTATSTLTFTTTGTPTGTPSATATATGTPTPSASSTSSVTLTRTPSFTFTATHTASSTPSPVVTATPTDTGTQTSTITPTCTVTPTITQTRTQTPTLPPTATPTPGVLFYLDRNQFRPARESLGLKVGLLDGQSAEIRVLTLTGRLVRQLAVSPPPGGYVQLYWDGRNQDGEQAASGIYFIVFESPNYRVVRKVLVIK